MKLTQLLTIIFLGFATVQAQEVKAPLEPQEYLEEIPESPGENYTWVQAHYEWDGRDYIWVAGSYIEVEKGYAWVNGEWQRGTSGWWVYNKGYWRKQPLSVSFGAKPVRTEESSQISTGEIIIID